MLFYLEILKKGGNFFKEWVYFICLVLEGVFELCYSFINFVFSYIGCVRLMVEK